MGDNKYFFEMPIFLKIHKVLKTVTKNSGDPKEITLILGLQLQLGKYTHSVQKNIVQVSLPVLQRNFFLGK